MSVVKKRSNGNDYKEVIINYLGSHCVWCFSVLGLEIHHILPVSRGGRNELANLEIVCGKCHAKLHKEWESSIPRKPLIKKCPRCGKEEVRRRIYTSKSLLCERCSSSIYNKKYTKTKNEI